MYKSADDYIEKLQELYPDVNKNDIKKIIEFGWRMFYFYNLCGCDVVIKNNKKNLWMYSGKLFYDSLQYYNYYKNKLRMKIRVLFRKKKIQWDGYYYTGLTEEEYNQLIESLNKKGRPRKHFEFRNKVCYKISDEAKISYDGYKCIIKFKYITDVGWSYKFDTLNCTDVSIYLVRDHPDTFKEILVSNYKYDYL